MPRANAHLDTQPKAPPAFPVEALSTGGPEVVAVPADTDLAKVMAEEAFWHEHIEIRILQDANPSAPKKVELAINTGGVTGPMKEDKDGVLQPGVAGRGGKSDIRVFNRGIKYTVPRYVAAALAGSKTTTTRQVSDPRNPAELLQVNEPSLCYPFEILRDDNPKGRAAIETIIAQPA